MSSLTKQATNEDVVQIRHFSIIDEAHYMLDFDNRPLRNLIAVGRNKGLSIILATQNMSSFKSKGFDFYANAQYPLIMKQQTIDDKVIQRLVWRKWSGTARGTHCHSRASERRANN